MGAVVSSNSRVMPRRRDMKRLFRGITRCSIRSVRRMILEIKGGRMKVLHRCITRYGNEIMDVGVNGKVDGETTPSDKSLSSSPTMDLRLFATNT